MRIMNKKMSLIGGHKARILVAAIAWACALPVEAEPKEGEMVWAQDREVFVHHPNYDAAKIPPYALEDPLTFLDGRKVTKENWPERRREILGIFAREMYGAEPPAPEAVVTELADEKVDAAGGFAIRRQYRMWFKADRSGPCVNWIVWIPLCTSVRSLLSVILSMIASSRTSPDSILSSMTLLRSF